LPDRPQSVENPTTPRTPHTPHTPYTPQTSQPGGESVQDFDTVGGGGGGNPNNPANPIPLLAMFERFGYFKLGLRGGSPIWSVGTGLARGGRHGGRHSSGECSNGAKGKRQPDSASNQPSCSSAAVVSKVASLVCVDYNDFDDENSHTPPLTPPPQDDSASSSAVDDKKESIVAVDKSCASEQDLPCTGKSALSPSEKPDVQAEIEVESSNNTKELLEEKCGEEIELAVISQEDVLNTDAIVSSELPVGSLEVEETDCENVVVFEHLSESDLAQVSSSIETDIIEECIVTSSDIVMDVSVVDALEGCDKLTSCMKDDDEENKTETGNMMEVADVHDELDGASDDIPHMHMDVMHILDTGVRTVLDRDPVLDMPEGCREIHSMNDRLRIGIVRSLGPLQQEKIIAITDTPESPDQEEMNVDPSPEPYLPTPDTIKDDEDDMMPMIPDDADVMELDEAGRTELENDSSRTEAIETSVTSSDELHMTSSVVSCQANMDTVEDSSRQVSSCKEATKSNLPFDLPPATQLPPSSVHHANIGIPGSARAVITYPTFPSHLTYARDQHRLTEEQPIASEMTATVITSAVTRQVTCVVPSVASVPRVMSFALDSELSASVSASPVTAAEERFQETRTILSAVVTQGTEVRGSASARLIVPECSAAAGPVQQNVVTAPSSFSIIKSSSPRRTAILQGSTRSSAMPVCIIRSQNSDISTTVSIISSAVASPVTSSRLTSATMANLVADAVSAARLPYPPASVGHQMPFATAGMMPLMTVSPSGLSVIASAGGVSPAAESLVPPPRMSTVPVTSSRPVPVAVETNSSSIPVVDTNQSSHENQSSGVEKPPHTTIQAKVKGESVDMTSSKYSASQTTNIQRKGTGMLDDTACELSQATRSSVLGTTSQNLMNELPLHPLSSELSAVPVIGKPLDDDDDDDDEILMKTVQLIFQDTRPSVLATVERATTVQQESTNIAVGSSPWQHSNAPGTSVIVSDGVSSSERQQSHALSDCKKELATSSPVHYSLPLPLPLSSNTVTETNQSEHASLCRNDSDKSSKIPVQTIAADSQSRLSESQIQQSTNLKLPLEAVDSAVSSQTHTDSGDAAVTSPMFSQAPQLTVASPVTAPGMKSLAETSSAGASCGQSMLESRLTSGPQRTVLPKRILGSQMVGRIATAPVLVSAFSPSVVATSRISPPSSRFSPVACTGQAVRQYAPYTHHQAAPRTSVVRSQSPQLLALSAAQLPAQGNVNIISASVPAEQFTQSGSVQSVGSSVLALTGVQHATPYGASSRTQAADVQVQEPVVTSVLGRLGADVLLSVSSESAASSRESGTVDSSECTTQGYPYASSAPPRFQSSCVFSTVMQPQRRMSTGEIKQEEPARSCQFQHLAATVKTETLDSCLFKNTPIPATSLLMQQQQQQSSSVVTAISKPLATSSIIVSQSSVATVVPKTEIQHLASSCKFATTTALSLPHRIEESQNVLLKQLLQNTGCAQQTSVATQHHTAPSLPVVPSLEAQLARPVPPTPTSLLPPVLTNDSPLSQPAKIVQISRSSQLTTREASFVSRPPPQVSTSPSVSFVCQAQQIPFSERRLGPPSRTPSREELLSPPTPATPKSCASGADSSLHTPSPLTSPHAVVIKKETVPPEQSPVLPVPSADVKKEAMSDESSLPFPSDKKDFHGKTEPLSKDEIGDLGTETVCDKASPDQAALGM
jgi:hypothetical protein